VSWTPRLICFHDRTGILWVGGWVGPRASLDVFGKEKKISCCCRESQSISCNLCRNRNEVDVSSTCFLSSLVLFLMFAICCSIYHIPILCRYNLRVFLLWSLCQVYLFDSFAPNGCLRHSVYKVMVCCTVSTVLRKYVGLFYFAFLFFFYFPFRACSLTVFLFPRCQFL
jgi:hypothetical protein